ncbi:MAG: hypothetical protein HYZ28_21030 [Myxococcales bacterium]|nr:hypothetical protein [Myxococcales bacterium]
MEAMTMLEKVSTAVERVLKDTRPVAKTQRMGPDDLVGYAIAQLEKAAKEPPDKAVRRLRALGQTVEAAKQAFVDSESEAIEVQVFVEETTAAADKSEKEVSPVALEAALGSSAFAANPEDLNKALTRLGTELQALRAPAQKADKGGEGKVAKGEDATWPFDMNTPEFREGVRKAEDGPAWGADPAGVRNPGA